MTESIDWGTVGQWAGVAAAIAIAIWGAMSSRNEKAIDELRMDRNLLFSRIDNVERDVAAMKVEIKHLPTNDDLHALDVKVTRIETKFDSLLDKLDTLIAQYERAEDRALQAEASR